MENIAHSLVGAALAEFALPSTATRPMRRAFMFAGVIAANLPDADLVYTSITPPPIGYLLHHRGLTHTVVGVAALGVLIALVALLPAVRAAITPARGRFIGLVAAALLSHLLLDWWNEYGIHPFYPIDNRWYYGDAISIIEPWFWVMLGVAAVANTQQRIGRVLLGLFMAAVVVLLAATRWISLATVLPLMVGAGAAAAIAARLSPRDRSRWALVGTVVFVAAMFGVNRWARAVVERSFPSSPGWTRLDIVLSPAAAAPFSWSYITIEKNESIGDYVMRRGSLTLAPRTQVDQGATYRQSIAALRTLARDNCSVRAWLQFGRAPVIDQGNIGDLRFGQALSANFSTMSLHMPAACPPHLTHWRMPREDLVESRGQTP